MSQFDKMLKKIYVEKVKEIIEGESPDENT